jgi:hypothetical protein
MANSAITQLFLRDTEYLTIQVVAHGMMALDSSIDSYIKAVHFELSFPLGGRCRVTSFFVTAGCSALSHQSSQLNCSLGLDLRTDNYRRHDSFWLGSPSTYTLYGSDLI